MRRYIFSQGTVRVEEGIYRPILNKDTTGRGGCVLILIAPPADCDTEPSENQDKEQDPHDSSE